ncbi:hypothetical protein REPUB_Repub11eG0082800 [Reevesia pubescens]
MIYGNFNTGWSCSFSHIYREENFCADPLAKSGCDLELDFGLLRSPPASMSSLLSADK